MTQTYYYTFQHDAVYHEIIVPLVENGYSDPFTEFDISKIVDACLCQELYGYWYRTVETKEIIAVAKHHRRNPLWPFIITEHASGQPLRLSHLSNLDYKSIIEVEIKDAISGESLITDFTVRDSSLYSSDDHLCKEIMFAVQSEYEVLEGSGLSNLDPSGEIFMEEIIEYLRDEYDTTDPVDAYRTAKKLRDISTFAAAISAEAWEKLDNGNWLHAH